MKWLNRLCFIGLGLGIVGLAQAQPWVRNMVDQPSIKPQERSYLLPVEGTVPRSGREPKRTWDEGNAVPNPLPHTQAVIKRGKVLYERFCSVCHGPEATAGGGPIAKIAPALTTPDLTMDIYINVRKDGYFYEIIRQGHILMPPYDEGTNVIDRWSIVHYLREIQKIRRFQP